MATLEELCALKAWHEKMVRELELAEGAVGQLNVVLRFLHSTGVDPAVTAGLMAVLGSMVDDASREPGAKGRPPRGINATLTLAFCAATVTALKERGMRMGEALKLVASRAGLDRKKLENFREAASRGREPEEAVAAYHEYLVELREQPDLKQAALRRIDGLAVHFP